MCLLLLLLLFAVAGGANVVVVCYVLLLLHIPLPVWLLWSVGVVVVVVRCCRVMLFVLAGVDVNCLMVVLLLVACW